MAAASPKVDFGPYQARLAENLIAAMRQAGLTIAELERRSGVSRETITRIRGGTILPQTEVLIKISMCMKNVTPGVLLDGSADLSQASITPIPHGPSEESPSQLEFFDLQVRVDHLEAYQRELDPLFDLILKKLDIVRSLPKSRASADETRRSQSR